MPKILWWRLCLCTAKQNSETAQRSNSQSNCQTLRIILWLVAPLSMNPSSQRLGNIEKMLKTTNQHGITCIYSQQNPPQAPPTSHMAPLAPKLTSQSYLSRRRNRFSSSPGEGHASICGGGTFKAHPVIRGQHQRRHQLRPMVVDELGYPQIKHVCHQKWEVIKKQRGFDDNWCCAWKATNYLDVKSCTLEESLKTCGVQ